MNSLTKSCDNNYKTGVLPVAVVWSRPDCEDGLRKVPLVALHHQLVGPADYLDVVGGTKLQSTHKHRFGEKD